VGAYGRDYGDAVSYGELSAMFPYGGRICVYQGSLRKLGFCTVGAFAVIQTGTIAAVGVALPNLRLLVCAFK
jgi:hypothetical protein